jgi:hypothetical protein
MMAISTVDPLPVEARIGVPSKAACIPDHGSDQRFVLR